MGQTIGIKLTHLFVILYLQLIYFCYFARKSDVSH